MKERKYALINGTTLKHRRPLCPIVTSGGDCQLTYCNNIEYDQLSRIRAPLENASVVYEMQLELVMMLSQAPGTGLTKPDASDFQ